MEEKSGFVLGAGAGPFHVLGMNSELMPNLSYRGEEATNLTHYARVGKQGGCVCEKISSGDCGLMANLFGSDGSPGMNFTEAIQKALQAEYGERTASLGGVFVIKKGKAKLHVMPREEVHEWLRYFGRSAPTILGLIFGWNIHTFSDHNEGGHCHEDTTPILTSPAFFTGLIDPVVQT